MNTPVDERGSGPWAASLPIAEALLLARLRTTPGLEAATQGGTLWVRGDALPEHTRVALRAVPWTEWFDRLPSDELRRPGHLLPSGGLPDVKWRPLTELLAPRLAVPVAPLMPEARVPLRLATAPPGSRPLANAMLLPWSAWAAYVKTAPAARLAELRFAKSARGEALVLGNALPAIPGRRLVETEGVCLPVGQALLPAIEPRLLRQMWMLPEGEIVLFLESDAIQRVPAWAVRKVTRAAVRLSEAGEEVTLR